MPQALLVAYTVYQGYEASQNAKEARDDRNASVAKAEGVAKEERDYYRQKFGGVSQMLVDYAMGNKPSPYLAKARGKVEAGYQKGMTQLSEIAGRSGLGSSGVGVGQKIGFGMEKAKTLAALDLEDQAQRYGVAQSLVSKEDLALRGSEGMQRANLTQADYANRDAAREDAAANEAYGAAGDALGSYVENLSSGGSWYGMKAKEAEKIESGGNKTDSGSGSGSGGYVAPSSGWSKQGGVGAGGYTGKLG